MRVNIILFVVVVVAFVCIGTSDGNKQEKESEHSVPMTGKNCPNKLRNDYVCKHGKVSGPCKQNKRKYYYDSKTKKCRDFIYGGCGGNDNNFETKEECESKCPRAQCQLACDPEEMKCEKIALCKVDDYCTLCMCTK